MYQLLEAMNKPIFNIYDLLMLMVFVETIIFASLLALRPNIQQSRYLLPCFIISVGLGQLVFLITYNPVINLALLEVIPQSWMSCFAFVFYTHGVLLYSYIRALTYEKFKFRKHDLTPIIIFIIMISFDYMTWFDGLFVDLFWRQHVLVGIVGFTITAIYAAISLIHMDVYSSRLKNQFSLLHSMDYIWLKIYGWGFFIIWTIEILPPFISNDAPWWLAQIITHSAGISLLVMINFVIFTSLLYAKNVPNLEQPENELSNDQKAIADIESADIQAIEKAILEDKAYRTYGLTIELFSDLTNIPVKKLSHIVNRYYEKNFYEFINFYRVEEARVILKNIDNNDIPIQDIYESVGFKSKSSFNTLFKKKLGMTPTEYRDKYACDPNTIPSSDMSKIN